MTRDEAKKWAPVIQAWSEGRTIQFKRENVWYDVNNPGWIEGVEYRIKPEPREWWVVFGTGRGVYSGFTCPTKANAQEAIMRRQAIGLFEDAVIVRVREVVEETTREHQDDVGEDKEV